MPIQETRMIARALTQRWPIKPEYRNLIVNQLMKVIASPDASPREKTAAAKALLSAEKQNQDDEHKQTDIDRDNVKRHRLVAIAARLGIAESVVLDAEAVARGRIEDDGGGSGRGQYD
jgi:hypothetical protein